MRIKKTFTVYVCAECLLVIANGFDGVALEHDRRRQIALGLTRATRTYDGHPIALVPTDKPGSFGWANCQVCEQDNAGGDRYQVTAIVEHKPVVSIDQTKPYTLECYGCGLEADTDTFGFGFSRRCPECRSYEIHGKETTK